MNKEKEIWKPIKGYEGYYEVSNLGLVRSVDRVIIYSNGAKHTYKGHVLALNYTSGGYKHVHLSINQHRKTPLVHRLVAEAFVPNPEGKKEVNHKDEDKTNNRADNLEWCDGKYNVNYGTRNQRSSKPIVQLTLEGNYIGQYYGASEAQKKTGIGANNISAALNDAQYTAGGYCWVYKEEYEECFKPFV